MLSAKQSGALMIEILVTIAIVVIGLWGLMTVQTGLQKSEIESYQRTQALLLLDDMANRMMTNRTVVDEYATDADEVMAPCAVSDPSTIAVTDPSALVDRDVAEWCLALDGASEKIGAGSAGALVAGQGCVEDLLNGRYRITVAWQGAFPLEAPDLAITCGQGDYNLPAGSACAEGGNAEKCRRVVAKTIRVGIL